MDTQLSKVAHFERNNLLLPQYPLVANGLIRQNPSHSLSFGLKARWLLNEPTKMPTDTEWHYDTASVYNFINEIAANLAPLRLEGNRCGKYCDAAGASVIKGSIFPDVFSSAHSQFIWIYPERLNVYYQYVTDFTRYGAGAGDVGILLDGAGKFNMLLQNDNVSISVVKAETGSFPSINRWYHIGYTFDGTNAWKMYRDGVEIYSFTQAWPGTGFTPNAFDIFMYHHVSSPFKGICSDLRLWDRQLTPEEIMAMYSDAYCDLMFDPEVMIFLGTPETFLGISESESIAEDVTLALEIPISESFPLAESVTLDVAPEPQDSEPISEEVSLELVIEIDDVVPITEDVVLTEATVITPPTGAESAGIAKFVQPYVVHKIKAVGVSASPLCSYGYTTGATVYTKNSVTCPTWSLDWSLLDDWHVLVTQDGFAGRINSWDEVSGVINVDEWYIHGHALEGKAALTPADGQQCHVFYITYGNSISIMSRSGNTQDCWIGFAGEVVPEDGFPIGKTLTNRNCQVLIESEKLMNLTKLWIVSISDQYVDWDVGINQENIELEE